MKVYRDKEINEAKINNPVATIGFFDGVHLGHSKILKRLLERSEQNNGESVIITLWPHPRIVLSEHFNDRFLITTLDEKISILEKEGIAHLVILPFTKELSQTHYKDFVQNTLKSKLNINHLVMGRNHHFGRNREGNYESLKSISPGLNIHVEKVEPVYLKTVQISSSIIRDSIQNGLIEDANRFLGYAFFYEGMVIEGEKLGRKIGFPTANISIKEPYKILPKNGVYAVRVEIDDQELYGMLNIGLRPTVHKQSDISVEVHIFNFNRDLYNRKVRINFIKRIRDEQKFNGIDQLKTQLEQDKSDITGFFNIK